MRDDPSISVLLPVHIAHTKVEPLLLLRRALESVRDQDLPDASEIIVVDDGSPVPVETFAPRLSCVADKVLWLRLERKSGVASALNAGLRAARYDLIARIDADDRWCEGKVAKQLALFVDDPELTICGTGMRRVTPHGALIDEHIRPGDWDGILRFFVEGGCPFPHGSIIARRDVFTLLGGYPHVQHGEDYTLWGTWLRFFKPRMIEEVLYDYTVWEQSASSIHAGALLRASQMVRDRFAVLALAGRLPQALEEFAAALDLPLPEAGRLAYKLWRNVGLAVRLPARAIPPLQEILPDRDISEPDNPSLTLELADIMSQAVTVRTDHSVTARPVG